MFKKIQLKLRNIEILQSSIICLFDNYKTSLTMFAVDCHASSYFPLLLLNLVLLEEKEETHPTCLLFQYSLDLDDFGQKLKL